MRSTEPREITESFRLERVLKSSRSAIVLRAADPGTGLTVAIKLIPPLSPATLAAAQQRFLAAVAALVQVPPGVFPAVLDHGFTPDGSAFMVMEFIEGELLDALTAAAPARILGLTSEIASGLEALARAGAAHGHITPDNVLARRVAGVERVCLLGFGTAAYHGTAHVGAGKGARPRFAPPEQLAPAAVADWRGDLYALAATCCALLHAEVVAADPPTVRLPDAVAQRLQDPAPLVAALERALRPDPTARPASFAEFRSALAQALAGGGHAFAAATPLAAAEASPPATATPAPLPIPAPPDRGDDTAPAHVVPLVPPPTPAAAMTPAPAALLAEVAAGTAAAAEEAGAASAAPPLAVAVAADDTAPTVATTPPATRPAPAIKPVRRKPWPAVAIGAALVVAAALAVVLLSARGSRPVRAAATPAPLRPTAAPVPTLAPVAMLHLQRAEAALALGDLDAVRAEFDALTPAEVGGLTAPEQQRFGELRATYLARRQHLVTRRMRAAIDAGDMAALAGVVHDMAPTEEAAFPRDHDFTATLADARRALELHAALLRAARAGARQDVLTDAAALLGLAPRCGQAARMREEAAAALERDADALDAAGDFGQALARLTTIRDSWPRRPGLAERIARVTADRDAAQRFAAAMASVEQAERRNAPEDGLALLRALPVDQRTAAQVAATRAQLTRELARLDVAPPELALASPAKLEYKKGQAATIVLRITDDHRVDSARFFARVEGSGQYVELPLRQGSANQWSVEISPEFHHNQTVDFYATAEDFSGHTGRLGSAEQPLKLKRKRNWLGF